MSEVIHGELAEVSAGEAKDNMQALWEESYPGRLVGAGLSLNGDELHLVTATMGRSGPSRRRGYKLCGDSIISDPLPSDGPVDPLTIYRTMTAYRDWHIATNGVQTDAIFDAMVENDLSVGTGHSQPLDLFEKVLLKQNHEPDSSHTARISLIVGVDAASHNTMPANFSVIRFDPEDPDNKQSSHYRFYRGVLNRLLRAGTGLCVTTYEGNGDPLPPFEGAPRPITIGRTAQETAETMAETLNANGNFLVSAAAKAVNLRTGRVEDVHPINMVTE